MNALWVSLDWFYYTGTRYALSCVMELLLGVCLGYSLFLVVLQPYRAMRAAISSEGALFSLSNGDIDLFLLFVLVDSLSYPFYLY